MAKQKSKAEPKRIASIKIPKSIRKSKTWRSLIANPVGREILAGALVAGAGAAATILLNEREAADAGGKASKKRARAMEIAKEAMKGAAAAMVAAVASNGSFKGRPGKAKVSAKSTH